MKEHTQKHECSMALRPLRSKVRKQRITGVRGDDLHETTDRDQETGFLSARSVSGACAVMRYADATVDRARVVVDATVRVRNLLGDDVCQRAARDRSVDVVLVRSTVHVSAEGRVLPESTFPDIDESTDLPFRSVDVQWVSADT